MAQLLLKRTVMFVQFEVGFKTAVIALKTLSTCVGFIPRTVDLTGIQLGGSVGVFTPGIRHIPKSLYSCRDE